MNPKAAELISAKYLEVQAGTTYVGLSAGPGTSEFIDAHPGQVDYVELPFEQLRHCPASRSIQQTVPIILHCASMSVAGFVPPTDSVLDGIEREAELTRTPWIGEHLAFVTADALGSSDDNDSTPTSLTYTVSPQLSEETLTCITENLALLQDRFQAPIILENPPQYFVTPGSTMSMVEFIDQVISGNDVGFLLDLSHFLIAMINTKADAFAEIERLPLEKIVEIHISGLTVQSGIAWDDHATPAPKKVFDLLERVLRRAQPMAITLEYNWSPNFPSAVLNDQLNKIQTMVGRK